MSEELNISLPMQVDDIYELELSSVGKNKTVKIVASELKMNKSNTGQVWNLQYENIKEPGTKLIYDYVSLPKEVEIQGAQGDGYINENGQKISKEDCAKRVAAAMRGIAQVVRAFKIPYMNKNGQSQVNFGAVVGTVCNNAEIVVKPATYKDGEPELPIVNPMDRGTENDPNFGRDKWDEDRRVVLPPLPKKEVKK